MHADGGYDLLDKVEDPRTGTVSSHAMSTRGKGSYDLLDRVAHKDGSYEEHAESKQCDKNGQHCKTQ